MGFYELAARRRSVRKFSSKPVTDAMIVDLLSVARLAPSASNRQPWHFIVVRDEERRRELARISGGQTFVGEAPVILAAVALEPERIMRCQVPTYAVDLAIAVDHITLAAEEMGLGSCWIGLFDQAEAAALLEVPAEYKVFTLLPLGHPADAARDKKRKSLEDIVSYEVFGGTKDGQTS